MYILDCRPCFTFGHAWPKTRTAAIKFHNNNLEKGEKQLIQYIQKVAVKSKLETNQHFLRLPHVAVWRHWKREWKEPNHQNLALTFLARPSNWSSSEGKELNVFLNHHLLFYMSADLWDTADGNQPSHQTHLLVIFFFFFEQTRHSVFFYQITPEFILDDCLSTFLNTFKTQFCEMFAVQQLINITKFVP